MPRALHLKNNPSINEKTASAYELKSTRSSTQPEPSQRRPTNPAITEKTVLATCFTTDKEN